MEFLAWNGYNLFIDLEAAFDFNNNITNALDHMKINLVIIVLVFSSFVSFLLCILLVNVYFSLKYINSTLKLPCSISIKDYKMLYNTVFDSKYRKSKSIKYYITEVKLCKHFILFLKEKRALEVSN